MYAILISAAWLTAAAVMDVPGMVKRKRKLELVIFALLGLGGFLMHAAYGLRLPIPNPLEFIRLFKVGGS
ncbi:hypothetical protein CGZ75_21830 [Paenibacillus herberti]|uniref:Uncharacterized protein n=1 Tax=Paenibacillus herberti TaxID=1619309 RepID=A0A229NUV7_9BACL|nr:hypothetical protein CGZ75_21830 [Paenibacillus herberti]